MTPTQRLQEYQTALAGLDERRFNNICYYLSLPVENYPELLKQKPRGKQPTDLWWTMTWQGMAARRRALNRAINELN